MRWIVRATVASGSGSLAVVAVVSGARSALVFMAAMLVGIALAHALRSDDRTE